jgi:hypothetical protein
MNGTDRALNDFLHAVDAAMDQFHAEHDGEAGS